MKNPENAGLCRASGNSMTDGEKSSAEAIVPHLLRLFPESASVADFGCGEGTFLKRFMQAGLEARGFGFGRGAGRGLAIPQEKFSPVNPEEPFSPPQKYDLALCLGIAGQLEAEQAEKLFDALCASSDTIIFSAAVPGKAGALHAAWQWPGHWIRIFEERGFQCLDVLRPLFWRDSRIDWRYRQNILLFLRNEAAPGFPRPGGMPSFDGCPLVHPDMHAHGMSEKQSEIDSLRRSLERRCDAMAAMALVIEKSIGNAAALAQAFEKNACALERLARHLPAENATGGRREKILRMIRRIPGAGICLRHCKKAALGMHGRIKNTAAWQNFKSAVNKTPVAGHLARKGKRALKRVIRP